MPFNYGPGNCIGRALAMNKMRVVLAALVRRFDMHLAPDFKLGNWERDLFDGYLLGRGGWSAARRHECAELKSGLEYRRRCV
jgi:hypothetical protein